MQATGTQDSSRDLSLSEAVRLGIPSNQAPTFLAADLSAVRSPWAIPGMGALVARIDAAARGGRRVLLFGDFDTDGTTATAILFATLARKMPAARRHNPWYSEGYGLQVKQVERFAAEGVQVIITIDNGITAHAAVERGCELGLETLIIDHHLPRSDIGAPPTTYIDPPDNVLSASEIGYLVAQALREAWWGETSHDDWGRAISAVGAQMDWMPLNVAENRGWVSHAQQIINSPACPPGLAAIRRELGEDYTSSELFTVAAPLNVGKRLKSIDPNLVTELLLPDTSDARRDEIAAHLVAERRRVEQIERGAYERATLDAERLRGERGMLIYPVISPDEDLAELEGPLASKLTHATGRPTLTLRYYHDSIAFSGRAAGTFSFASFISDAGLRQVVTNMGGHAKAMGGAFKPERLDDFIAAVRAWEQTAQGQDIWADTTEPPVRALELPELDPAIAHTLARALGPFGHHFRRPAYRTMLHIQQGRAFSGAHFVQSNIPLPEGIQQVVFTFDEAQCDGQHIGIQVFSS